MTLRSDQQERLHSGATLEQRVLVARLSTNRRGYVPRLTAARAHETSDLERDLHCSLEMYCHRGGCGG